MPYLIIIAVLVIYYFLTKPNHQAKERFKTFQNIAYAHRGLHDLDKPENTLLAFQNAINQNYGIELDVQITKDHKIVVFHDYDLLRAANKDLMIDQLTYLELNNYSIFNSAEKIPLLEDVLKLINGKVPLIIEIKQKGADCLTTELTSEILKSYQGQYCIESFNPMALNWYRKNHPEIVRGQLATKLKKEDATLLLRWALTRLLLNFLSRPDFVAYEHYHLNHLRVKVQRYLYQVPILTWTVDDISIYNQLNSNNTIIFENFLI